jgi:thiol-disulfide isomerase/thioredoxin
MRTINVALWAMILLGLAACGSPGTSDPSDGIATTENSPPASTDLPGSMEVASTPPSTGAVSLRLVDVAGVRAAIAQHAGEVAVMDCWSTWCEPCMREFPHLVAMHNELASRGVACLSLNMDYDGLDEPDQLRPAVIAFLEKQHATLENLMSSTDSETVYRELEFSSVPTVFVYGRDGTLARKFSGSRVDYAEVRRFVEELLQNSSGS